MKFYRSILAGILALLISFTAINSSWAATNASSYTPEQLERIQRYLPSVQTVRNQFPELQGLIQKQKWTDVRDLIHGPFGTLRQDLVFLIRNLSPSDKVAATETFKTLFVHLVGIDKAAEDADYRKALRQSAEAIVDFDAFLSLIPE